MRVTPMKKTKINFLVAFGQDLLHYAYSQQHVLLIQEKLHWDKADHQENREQK